MTKRTSIVLSEKAYDELEAIAKKRDRSRNYVMVEAIGFYLEQNRDKFFPVEKPQPVIRKKKAAGAR
jgi:predicted DNA-binding protein